MFDNDRFRSLWRGCLRLAFRSGSGRIPVFLFPVSAGCEKKGAAEHGGMFQYPREGGFEQGIRACHEQKNEVCDLNDVLSDVPETGQRKVSGKALAKSSEPPKSKLP